jgi:hypothetical protein
MSLGVDEEDVREDEWSSSSEKLVKRHGKDDPCAMAIVAMPCFFGSSSLSLESHCWLTWACPWYLFLYYLLFSLYFFSSSFLFLFTTRKYLICDAFYAMFSENITNVHAARTLWRFVKFVAILWRIPVFRHECALKPKTQRQFVKFVAILRRIPVFHHGCALMDILAQNTATL